MWLAGAFQQASYDVGFCHRERGRTAGAGTFALSRQKAENDIGRGRQPRICASLRQTIIVIMLPGPQGCAHVAKAGTRILEEFYAEA